MILKFFGFFSSCYEIQTVQHPHQSPHVQIEVNEKKNSPKINERKYLIYVNHDLNFKIEKNMKKIFFFTFFLFQCKLHHLCESTRIK